MSQGSIRTRRWNDKKRRGDGLRLLICRYRPRALPKDEETWDLWWKHLGHSAELHAAYYGKKDYEAALKEYKKVLELNPANVDGHIKIALMYASCPEDKYRDGDKALEWAKKVCDMTEQKNARALDALAAAYAEVGAFNEAALYDKQALAVPNVAADIRADFQARLQLYANEKPYRAQ